MDANGTPTAADADADRGQNYSWASVGYGDWMYVGTCYSAMGSTLKLMASKMGTTYSKTQRQHLMWRSMVNCSSTTARIAVCC